MESLPLQMWKLDRFKLLLNSGCQPIASHSLLEDLDSKTLLSKSKGSTQGADRSLFKLLATQNYYLPYP